MESLHQPGDIIAQRYRITDTLGQGGVGITYKAEDLKSGQEVALKALSLRRMGDWKVLELFEREARILAQLDHPAIPRYLDYFQVDTPEDRGYYIAQQLAEGKSLAELVEIGWRTNESGVRRIATQVLEILIYLHDLKPPVVHRDIKPQNLIWGKDGKIFLVDFGAVQDTYHSTLAKGSTIVGTYAYMAPEQFRGQAVPATDLYGLGTTLLFLLTHRSPSDLPQERLKISFRSRIQVSEGFADWLEKMLEPDVEDRFSSAKEALDALQGRMVVAKARSSVSWKALVGVGLVAVATVTVLNSYKWAVLGPLGFQPTGICEAARSGKLDVVRDYLKHGGNPIAKDDGELLLLPCLLSTGKKDIEELVIANLPDINARDDEGKTPLHFALLLFEGSKVAEVLIAKGADVNAKDNQGKTPLHFAGSKERAELLIAKGADVNAKDNQGQTPLDIRFQYVAPWLPPQDEIDLLKLLIAKGAYANVNAKDARGSTLLHRIRSSQVAELLIAQGADVNAKNQEGETPLHGHLCSANSKDMVKLLIANRADINARDNKGTTPLHHICGVFDGVDTAKLLIANRADINARDNKGATPLHHSVWGSGGLDTAKLLIAQGADVNAKDNEGRTALQLALKYKFKEMAALLIANGADVNVKDNKGHTPLQIVISDECSCERDLIKLLITKGADINVKSPKGFTPMELAVVYDWKDIAELLIAKGVQVNGKDNNGMTPLHWAAVSGTKNVAELLLAKGAQVNAKNNEGQSPLQLAALSGKRQVAELLIAKGAQVNARTNQGSTPLQVAAAEGHRDVAELLISQGAEVNTKRDDGMTPLHRAAAEGHIDVVELLIARGAKINARDNESKTPLSWALKKGDKNIIELLKSHGATE